MQSGISLADIPFPEMRAGNVAIWIFHMFNTRFVQYQVHSFSLPLSIACHLITEAKCSVSVSVYCLENNAHDDDDDAGTSSTTSRPVVWLIKYRFRFISN